MPLEIFGQEKVERPAFNSDRKRTKFVDLTSTATIRILTKERLTVNTHYIPINKSTVKCLGDECPICANNKNLIVQFPDSFRDEPHYSPRREVKLVNVLDRTPVRTCTNDGTEERTSLVCTKCNAVLGEPKPSNTVKVLSRGITLFDSLDAINNAIMDDKGEPVGITNYDVTLVVSGTGKNRTTTPIAGQISPLPIDIAEDQFFDLEKITIELTPTEMLDLQRGVSMKDIFAARKASAKTEDDPFVSQDVLDSARSDVESLFKNA